MTRQEAIAYGKRVIDLGLNDETQAFCELSIKALEHPEQNVIAVVPCGDCISRLAAIDLIADFELSMGQVVRGIHALPSVKPQQKTGHWKIKRASIHPYGNDVACSECGFTMGSSFGYKHCPSCGARMVEPQESEV